MDNPIDVPNSASPNALDNRAPGKRRTLPAPEQNRSGSFLDNLKVWQKLALIVLTLTLGIGAVSYTSFTGLRIMRYHLYNIYEFMFVPIVSINQAEALLGSVQTELATLTAPGLSVAERSDRLADIETLQAEIAPTIDLYTNEWLTTLSPEFTATLRDLGRLDLQRQEVEIFNALSTNYKGFETAQTGYFNSVRSGSPDAELGAQMVRLATATRTQLQNLIEVNDSFAELSYRTAVSTYDRSLRALWAGLGVSLLLGLALAYLISRSIIRPVQKLVGIAERVSRGDLSQTAAVTSKDEIGQLARTFNGAVTKLRGMVQTEAERDEERLRRETLQSNIGNFLDVAMDIADGDFTKRGQVSEDALGNVVDAINLMIEEIALLLGEVQKTALSVNQGAGEMIGSAGAIAENTQLTADEAQRVRSEVQRVILSIQDVAERASSANEAATRALGASQEGQEAVNTTLTGMAGIREETRTTAERMHGLVERSAEISEIVETISHIASQTNLLALGAALEAAGAGEAGDRFAVVADEVRKLADESAEAASRIYTLINTVQSEVREVGEQVARNAVEVDTGYRLAGQAGERLREITESVQRSAQLVEGISQVTGAQTRGVEEVGVAVQSMAELTDTARERVLQGQETAATLQRLAERLTEALVRFRLA